MSNLLPEIGCYGLAGHSAAPRDLLAEVRLAEHLGIGSVFLSERFNVKDAAALAGAAVAVSERIGVATAATNHNTRHPLVTATMATTLHRMSGGRYALGLGRGFDLLFDVMGLPRVTSAQLEDVVGIYRRLWHGQAVAGHEGPAGSYPYLSQDPSFDEDIPVLLVAIGDATLRLAGRIADGVVLHTFLTDEALARAVATVRALGRGRRARPGGGADLGGARDRGGLEGVGVGGEAIDEERRLRKLVGRLATYLQGYGDVLVRANGWDPAVLQRFREDPLVSGYPGAFDAIGTVEDLTAVAALLPPEWLAAAATGSPAQCAARVQDQFDAGADGVILHGATPDELAPVLDAWRGIRPAGRFADLPVNPGRSAVSAA